MRAARRFVGGILLVPLALACAAPEPERAPGEVPEWTLQRVLVIGSPDHPVYAFSDVGSVLADEDRVYVLMRQEGTIRVFTRDGEFVRDLGGRGEGPGEMAVPTTTGWRGPGTIWVGDTALQRFTFYDVATGEAETIPYRVYAPDAHGTTRFEPVVAVADFRAAAAPSPPNADLAQGILTTFPLVVLDTAGTVRDTLALLSVPILVEITAGVADDGMLRLRHPLEEGDKWRFARDGSSAAIVEGRSWTGAGPAEFGVTKVDAEGDTLFHRRLAYEPRPVPDSYYDDEINLWLDTPVVVDRRALADAIRESYEQTRYLPPVTSATLGSDETVWLAGVDEDGEREWPVLDGSGSSIGRFRLATTSRVSTANRTEARVVERDALDIPYVVQYEIVR